MTKCAFHEDVNQPYFPDLTPPRPKPLDFYQKQLLQVFRNKLNDINTQAAKLIRDIEDNSTVTIGGDFSQAVQVLRWRGNDWDYLDRLDMARERLQRVIAKLEVMSVTTFDWLVETIGSGASISTEIALETNNVILSADSDLDFQDKKPRLFLVG